MRPRLATIKIIVRSGMSALWLALALTVCAVATAQLQTRITPRPFDSRTAPPFGGSNPGPSGDGASPLVSVSGAFLHSFVGYPDDGNFPLGGPVEDGSGNVYGTTQSGGSYNLGIIYEVSAAGTYSILYSFGGPDGQYPSSTLISDSNGNLYGTTYAGGAHNLGVVFKVLPPPSGSDIWTVKVLHSFRGTPDGAHPVAGLVMDPGGYLYGVTSLGGARNFGAVFKLDSNSTADETVLYNFAGGNDGAYPLASLVIDPGGNHYGVTTGGGWKGLGTAFHVRQSGRETLLHTFKGGLDGAAPYYAALIRDAGGNLYGTTAGGGEQAAGTLFELPVTGGDQVLYYFCRFAPICGDGAMPLGGLLQGADGLLYGMTAYGGYYGGVIYSFNLANDAETPLVAPGIQGTSSLIQDKSGTFYGTSWSGGETAGPQAYGYGTFFRFTVTP